MTIQKDPERNEIKHLQKFANVTSRRVLEIGSGEGRLTWKYAKSARSVTAVDLDLDSLRVARVDRPSDLEHSVHFACVDSIHLPFAREKFDLALLAWSL